MKEKRLRLSDRVTVILALGILLAAGLYALLWPHPDFSDAERRNLSAAPSAPSLTAWTTDKETESWLSDRIPFRPALVGLDSCVQVATGRRTLLESWPVAGALIEPPTAGSAGTAQRRLGQFDALAGKLEVPWHLVVPRSHGWLLRGRMNSLMRAMYEEEQEIYGVLEQDPHFLDVLPEGTDPSEVYYRTDHHWTLQGAYLAYRAVCGADQLPVLQPEDFRLSRFDNFFGTTRSRSGLPALRGDTLECAEPREAVRMTLEDGESFDRLIFPEHAETYDGYAVYLNGNHGMLEIVNESAPGGTLLVFKDSYANCLLPMLAADYRRIVAVDARYYPGTFSEAAAAAGKAVELLFVYSPDSLVNDTSIAGKAGR